MNPRGFEQFLLDENLITRFELAINPSIIIKLMNDEDTWNAYREDLKDSYL
ncbi:MAG: hypothetical protein KW806_02960 [Candidatus Yanofskybacteria bacterium]|nr:hypothetical protein [Candidatus Yanofskybacteria bacterium]